MTLPVLQKIECDCEKCQKCCWHNPGWFGSIEEVEGAAKLKGMTVKEFCREYLIREWFSGDEEIEIPAPRRDFDRYNGKDGPLPEIILDNLVKENGEGFVRASWGHNLVSGFACVFLDENNRCTIHESKPRECAIVTGCDRLPRTNNRSGIQEYWAKHQDFIKANL